MKNAEVGQEVTGVEVSGFLGWISSAAAYGELRGGAGIQAALSHAPDSLKFMWISCSALSCLGVHPGSGA